MASSLSVKVIEQCKISPSSAALAELSLPLSFLDLVWVDAPTPIQKGILFYEFPHPKTHMVETIIPSLKASLSRTLKHFLPLAGNLIIPLKYGIPSFRFVVGDTFPLTFAESDQDFDYLKGYHARKLDDFSPLLPELPPIIRESDSEAMPLAAIQVTLFPNFGFCIGLSYHHAACDGIALAAFWKAWGAINKLGGDAELLAGNKSLSVFSSVTKETLGQAEMYWNKMKEKTRLKKLSKPDYSLHCNDVLVTFVLNRVDIQKLKGLILKKRPDTDHVSAFTVTCALVWSCLVKAGVAIGEKTEDDELEYLIAPVDSRARSIPPLPTNYFGNCLDLCLVKAKHCQLILNEGFLNAAVLVAEAISKMVRSKGEILKDALPWMEEFESMNPHHTFGVAGSPRFDMYEIDFGWGKTEKFDIISVGGFMSLSKFKKSEGALEFGLSLSKPKMDAFTAIFTDSLTNMEPHI